MISGRFPRASAQLILIALSLAPTLSPARAEPPAAEASQPAAHLRGAIARAQSLERLRSLIVARRGEVLVERGFRGGDVTRPTNIKSASKTIMSALVGMAIDKKIIPGLDAPILPLLGRRAPAGLDPRVGAITVGHLLSMQAGLEPTSGRNYGRWAKSRNWVNFALTRPFVDEPGGAMVYSTGSTHLLSAILTEASGRSTFELAQEWLAEPLDISIPRWQRDPQGIFMGGNNLALTPRALLRFGELYRQRGMLDGKRVLPESWIEQSWKERTLSPYTGHGYGLGWFVTDMAGHPVYYAWGFGGQMIYVVPALDLTVVVTSTPDEPSDRDGYIQALHHLVEDDIVAVIDQPVAGLPSPAIQP
jgi:CubicO group peptidase (beta-lactamase class C family)